MTYKSCHCCGLVQTAPSLASDQRAYCARCRTPLARSDAASGKRSSARTAAAALGAFVLFWPAILLPILEVEKLGHHHQSSILMGTLEMLQHGDWLIGGIVFLFSVVFPLVKIVLLLELSWLGLLERHHQALTYRVMEHLGKWSMMDVLLLAFLVMLLKLGALVEFQFGPAVFAFAGCVIMSMLASLCFDPHAIWEES